MSHHSRWFFWKTVPGIQDVNPDTVCVWSHPMHVRGFHGSTMAHPYASDPGHICVRIQILPYFQNPSWTSFLAYKFYNQLVLIFFLQIIFTTECFRSWFFEQGYGSCTVTLMCTWAGDWGWLGSFWMANSLTRSCPLRRPIFLPVDPAFDHPAAGFFKHRIGYCVNYHTRLSIFCLSLSDLPWRNVARECSQANIGIVFFLLFFLSFYFAWQLALSRSLGAVCV